MTATYTFDVFTSLDGFGSYSGGNWGGYWGKQGAELLEHRLALYGEEQRMVFGASTYRQFARLLASSTEESEVSDPWVTRMRNLPATVVSTTLKGRLDWPDATVVSGDPVDIVARLKEESEVPLRSHGSLSLNRADGRRPGRPRPGDALPCDHRSDRSGPDLRRCGRLRPRADREPDARRPHPRAHLPAHPACLSPSVHPPCTSAAADLSPGATARTGKSAEPRPSSWAGDSPGLSGLARSPPGRAVDGGRGSTSMAETRK